MRTSNLVLLGVAIACLLCVSQSDANTLINVVTKKNLLESSFLKSVQHKTGEKLTMNPIYHDTEWTTREYGRIGTGAQPTLSYYAQVCNLAELEAAGKFFEVSVNLPLNTDPWKQSKGVARLEIHNTQSLSDNSQALYTNYILRPGTNVVASYLPVIGFAALTSDFPDGQMYLVISTGVTGEAADVALHVRILSDCSTCQVSNEWFFDVVTKPIPSPVPLRQYAGLDATVHSVPQWEYNQHFVKFCRANNQDNSHWGLIAVVTATDARSGMSAFFCAASNAPDCVSGSPTNIVEDFMLPNSAYASVHWVPTGSGDLDGVISILGVGGLDADNHYTLTLMESEY